jgi:hypothetical protein
MHAGFTDMGLKEKGEAGHLDDQLRLSQCSEHVSLSWMIVTYFFHNNRD